MNKATLDRLREISHVARDAAGRELASARTGKSRVTQQLHDLADYHKHYSVALDAGKARGASVGVLRNYGNFMASLGSAIVSAQSQLDVADRQVEARATDWRSCQQRMLSYDTLAMRLEHAAVIAENRIEQRESDERVTQAVARKVLSKRTK